MRSKIVICIPIDLENRQAIATALAEEYGSEWVLLGRVFKSTIGNENCAIDILSKNSIYERQIDLSTDFELSGQNKFSGATLEQIERCDRLVFLRSDNTGYNACLVMARLTQVFLSIGGVAVKVESAGIAHTKDKWLANYDSRDVFEIYSLYVVLVEGDSYYYSAGMHNFGKADVAISSDTNIGLAIYVMNVFNYYRLTESPILQDGHTFRPDIECPSYQIKLLGEREHPAEDERYNPYGRWLLTDCGL